MRVGAMPCLPEPPFSVCVLLCQVEQCTQLIRGGRNVFFFFSFPSERDVTVPTRHHGTGAVWSYFGSSFIEGYKIWGKIAGFFLTD